MYYRIWINFPLNCQVHKRVYYIFMKTVEEWNQRKYTIARSEFIRVWRSTQQTLYHVENSWLRSRLQGVFAYQMYTYQAAKYGDYKFPAWADAIGILIGLATLVPLPLFCCYRLYVGPVSFLYWWFSFLRIRFNTCYFQLQPRFNRQFPE